MSAINKPILKERKVQKVLDNIPQDSENLEAFFKMIETALEDLENPPIKKENENDIYEEISQENPLDIINLIVNEDMKKVRT